MTDGETVGRQTERLAEDLRERGLEPRPHGRGPRVHREGGVGLRLHVRRLERPEPGLLHVGGEADAATHAARGQRALLGARPVVVEPLQQLLEERWKIARVVHGRSPE